MEAVNKWRFGPRMIDGQPALQKDTQTLLTFDVSVTPVPEHYQLLKHVVLHQYPVRCSHDAEDVEYVKLRYDITAEGTTKNIEIVESSHACLNAAAVWALEQWLYESKIVDGEAVERTGLEVTLTFELQ